MTNSTDAVQTSHSVVSDMYLHCFFRPFSLLWVKNMEFCVCVSVCVCVLT